MERRNTKQRKIILDAVRSRCDHPTAEQIYEQVSEKDSKISLGTVYRNLSVLAQEGEIKDVSLAGADRFDLRTENHNHFSCKRCGKVYDIDIPYDEKENSIMIDGFLVEDHYTVYSGICPDCLEEQEKQ